MVFIWKKKERIMPIYEYECLDCGKVSELLVGIGRNSDELKCVGCGGSSLKSVMSVPSQPAIKDSGPAAKGACCGSNPSATGCVPGSCCGNPSY